MPTVADLLDFLEADYRAKGLSYWRSVRYLLPQLRSRFGALEAETFRGEDWLPYQAELLKSGRAPATVNRYRAALRRAFSLARKLGVTAAAPHLERLPEDNARQGFVGQLAFERLQANLPEHYRDFARWLYWTGWRLGEARALLWSHVDLEARDLTLPARLVKARQPRTLPLPAPLLELLRRRWKARWYREARQRLREAPHVFHRYGLPIGNLYRAWHAAARRAGLAGLLPHDLRRSAVRNLRLAGVPESVAMRITGHKTREVFLRYDIVDPSELADALVRTIGRPLSGGR